MVLPPPDPLVFDCRSIGIGQVLIVLIKEQGHGEHVAIDGRMAGALTSVTLHPWLKRVSAFDRLDKTTLAFG